MIKLKFFGVLFLAVLLVFSVSCVYAELGDGEGQPTTEEIADTQTDEAEVTEASSTRGTESVTSATAATEPATTVREPALDGFPNEAESGGTKRY